MRIPLFTLVLFSTVVIHAIGDASKDREECAEQLVGMATCLPYVGGQAKAPTPDCCSGLKQVLQKNKKCLCVIIRDRNDPEFGLTINVTLALGLPSVCHSPANVSKCPELLHMAPNSPDAQVFYQLANDSSNSAHSATASSPTSNVTANPSSSNANEKIAPVSTNSCRNGNRWLGSGLDVIVGGVLLWLFTHSSLI